MIRALLEILALTLFCVFWLTCGIAYGQEIKYTKDGTPYIPASDTLIIQVNIIQCGTLDETVQACNDGQELCCQLLASTPTS